MIQELRRRGYLASKRVEEAMLAVDRADFTPKNVDPYIDMPYPVGERQTISAPSVVAFMLDHLDVSNGMKVLEIGTGSGYNAALLSHLVGKTGHIISIEIHQSLCDFAEKNLEKYNLSNIELICADGSKGYVEKEPYDRIIVTAGMPYIEKHPLLSQLKYNGKLVAPVGDRFFQNLVLYDANTKKYKNILPVMFVPLTGEFGFK